MPTGKKIWLAAAALVLSVVGYLLYRQSTGMRATPAEELIRALPGDAGALVYFDLAALRQSVLLANLRALAPSSQTDAEYAEFVRATGFDYERDLDRVAIATTERSGTRTFYAIVEGRFDPGKIAAQALKSGKRERRGGLEVFTTPVHGSARQITLAFLSKERMVLTDSGDLGPLFATPANDSARADVEERAARLAGSPVFAILHPEPGTLSTLAARIPGGVRFEQFAALAGQLRWITLAARPDGERTRIVIEGESASEDAARQIAGLLENLLVVGRLALEDPKVRARMDSAEHGALVEVLKTAEVSKLDRGETKSVRLVLSAGPKLFAALQIATPHVPDAPAAPATAGARRGKQ